MTIPTIPQPNKCLHCNTEVPANVQHIADNIALGHVLTTCLTCGNRVLILPIRVIAPSLRSGEGWGGDCEVSTGSENTPYPESKTALTNRAAF